MCVTQGSAQGFVQVSETEKVVEYEIGMLEPGKIMEFLSCIESYR